MNKLGTFILASAAGFVAGVLLAPKSGKDTRHDIMEKAKDYKSKANDGLDEAKKGARLVKAELAEGADAVREIALDVGDSVGQGMDRFKDEVGRRAGTIGKDISATSKDVKKVVSPQDREQQKPKTPTTR